MTESDIAARYAFTEAELHEKAARAVNQCCEPSCEFAWLILEVRRLRAENAELRETMEVGEKT